MGNLGSMRQREMMSVPLTRAAPAVATVLFMLDDFSEIDGDVHSVVDFSCVCTGRRTNRHDYPETRQTVPATYRR